MKKNLVLYITNNCNLNCKYCFVNKEKKVMDLKCYKKIFNKYKEHISNITFFGGEPLLYKKLIEDIITYNLQMGYNYNYIINTNAILIDDVIISLCKKHNILLNVSLDGNKTSNSKNRFSNDIFDLVYNNIDKVLKNNIKTIINYVITPNNIRYLKDSLTFFHNSGFLDICFLIDYDALWKKSDIELLRNELLESINIIRTPKNNRYMRIYPIWNKMNAVSTNTKVIKCTFGNDSIVSSPDGKIYPCISFIENDKYEIKDDNTKFENISDIKKCISCEYEKFCVNNCMCRTCYRNKKVEIDVNCECEKIFIDIAKLILDKLVFHK